MTILFVCTLFIIDIVGVTALVKSCQNESYTNDDLEVPFSAQLDDGIKSGATISVKGKFMESETVNASIVMQIRTNDGKLCSPVTASYCNMVHVRYDVTLYTHSSENKINLQSDFETEQKKVDNPFRRGEDFEMKIVADDTGFNIFADDVRIHKYIYYRPNGLKQIQNIYVGGNLDLKTVDLQCMGDIRMILGRKDGGSSVAVSVIGMLAVFICGAALIGGVAYSKSRRVQRRTLASTPYTAPQRTVREEISNPPPVTVTGAAIPSPTATAPPQYTDIDQTSTPPSNVNDAPASQANDAPPSYDAAIGGDYVVK